MRRAALALLLLFGPVLWPGLTSAQIENPVKWSLAEGPTNVAPGAPFELALTARIDPGWHLYSITQPPGGPIQTRITIPADQPFGLAAAPAGPAPTKQFDPNFSMETEWYDDAATFRLPIVAAPGTPAGLHRVEVHVRFQTCNDRLCMPPRTEKLAAQVTVVGGAEVGVGPGASDVAPPAPQPTAIPVAAPVGSANLWSFIWLAMTVGALSLLTPCVFPMVPITVSYFTNHAAGSRSAAVGNALVYSFGIILTFTALGMVLALVVGASGLNSFAANPWINLLITAIFLGFAMNLFGAYELTPPASLLTRLDALTRREGGSRFVGTLLMGLTFALTSFTCTAPFVGTLLVMASQGSWKWPLLGMIAFSSVFALPFFVLALLPQFVAKLPRSGGWLNAVKVSMGFIEVAAAMKFLSNVDLIWGWDIFTRDAVLAIWIALGVLLCLYLIGSYRLPHDSTADRIGAWRLGAAITSLAITIYLVTGLFGSRLGEIEAFLPPAAGADSAQTGAGTLEGELGWIVNDYDQALATAASERRLMLIDFTGYTCTNCRWMEANMFPRPDVRGELERFVRVKLYTDGDGEKYEKHQKFQADTFGTVALPFYAVMSSDGRPLATYPGLTRDPAEFLAFLRGAN
jgi:thiol:disulfide interchange protein DsbD